MRVSHISVTSTCTFIRAHSYVHIHAHFRTEPAPGTEVFPLPAGNGHLLDIEINITWPNGSDVPYDFGAVGVSVLGGVGKRASNNKKGNENRSKNDEGDVSGRTLYGDVRPDPSRRSNARTNAWGRASASRRTSTSSEAAKFDAVQHGASVAIVQSSAGSIASWGAVSKSTSEGSCNAVAFLDTRDNSSSSSSSYWLRLDPAGVGNPETNWVDYGWCSRSIGYQVCTFVLAPVVVLIVGVTVVVVIVVAGKHRIGRPGYFHARSSGAMSHVEYHVTTLRF